MPEPILALTDVETIRRIARQALEVLGEPFDEDFDLAETETIRRGNLRIDGAKEALRFCAVAAGLLGDPALVPLIVEAYEALNEFDRDAPEHASVAASAVAELLRAGAPVTAEIRAFARHSDACAREAVAAGLRPIGPEALEILESLSGDAHPEVRTSARKTLAAVREVSWWRGKFRSDPVPRLTPDEIDRVKPAIERLSQLLDRPAYNRPAKDIEAAVRELPTALAAEAAECALSGEAMYGPLMTPLGVVLLETSGGVDALLRLCERWSETEYSFRAAHAVTEMLQALPSERVRQVCDAWLLWLEKVTDANRHEQTGSAAIVAEAVGVGWPKGTDPTPILEAILAPPSEKKHDLDWVRCHLDKAFDRADLDCPAVLNRVIEARIAGWPGAWKAISHHVADVLDRASVEVMRPAAERAVASEDEGTIQWGLELLAARAYDPRRDPPRKEYLRKLYEAPRFRVAIIESWSLRGWFLVFLRMDLRAGRFDFQVACATMKTIDRFYGGLIPGLVHADDSRQEREKSWRENRAKHGRPLGAKDLHGPPTEAEWAMYRRTRATAQPSGRLEWFDALGVLPEGPWEPDDRAFLEQAIAKWRAGDEDAAFAVALALSHKPTPADLATLDALQGIAGKDDHGHFRECRLRARRALGLAEPREGSPADAGESLAEREWMDEEEEA